jgi:integrase
MSQMGVLIECPKCHHRQSLKHTICYRPECHEDFKKAKKQKRLRYWISYYTEDKKQHFEKIKGKDGLSLAYARDAQGKRRGQIREDTIFEAIKPGMKMTFKELSDWYLDLEDVKGKRYFEVLTLNLKKFNSEFGSRIISTIKPSELRNYQAKRQRQGKADSTIDGELAAAKVVINAAYQDEKISDAVTKRFKSVKKLLEGNANARNRTLTPEEFERLVEKSNKFLKPLVLIAYWTGMRRGEIFGLNRKKISLKDRLIRLRPEDTKTKKGREIPIGDVLYEVLNSLPAMSQKVIPMRDDFPIFNRSGKRIKDIRAALSSACKKAGFTYGRNDTGFIFHDLRRTFFTDMRKAGVPESVIMEITGHSRKGVIARYDQINLEDKRRAIEKLAEDRKKRLLEGSEKNLNQNLNQTPFEKKNEVIQISANPLK